MLRESRSSGPRAADNGFSRSSPSKNPVALPSIPLPQPPNRPLLRELPAVLEALDSDLNERFASVNHGWFSAMRASHLGSFEEDQFEFRMLTGKNI
jgi:hypothetical protein